MEEDDLGNNKQSENDENLQEVNALINNCDYENAKILLEKLFKKNPNKIEIIDLLSDVYFNLDNCEGAKKMLKKSIKLDPENNPEKYMTLAQLVNDPSNSVNYYTLGIQKFINILNNTKTSKNNSNNNDNKEIENLKQQIATGYATIAELHMTSNLCDKPDAEQICEESLKEAIKYCPNSIDALLQLSNLRILRARNNEAKVALEEIYNLINKMDANNYPDHDILLNISKNFAEIGCYEKGIFFLDLLIKIDDEDLEVWYLLAFYHYQIKNFQFSMKCVKNFQKKYTKISGKNKIKNELLLDLEDAAKELFNTLSNIKGELKNNSTAENNEQYDNDVEEDMIDDEDEEMS